MEQANFPAFPLNEMERRLKAYMEKHPKLQNTVFTPDELSQFIARLHQENKGAMQSYDWNKEWAGNPHFSHQNQIVSQLEAGEAVSESMFSIHRQSAHIPEDVLVSAFQMIRYMPAHWHKNDYLEIYYVVSGSCPMMLENETIWMPPGTVLFLAPFAKHATPCYSDDCVLLSFLIRPQVFMINWGSQTVANSIVPNFIYHALNDKGGDTYLRFDAKEDLHLRTLFLQLHEEFCSSKRYQSIVMTAKFYELLIQIIREHEDNAILPSSNSVRWHNGHAELFGYIQTHYATLTLNDLAEKFGYSKRQMIRIITNCTGTNFNTIVWLLRIDQACRLLRDTDTKVEEIAQQVGYQNLSAFHRAFAKRMDTTPAKYRAQHLKKHVDYELSDRDPSSK